MMGLRRTFAALLTLTFPLSQASFAATNQDRADEIMAEAKTAAGGAAWDRIAGWRERGKHGDVAYETLLNFRRYGSVFKSTRDGKTKIDGYNGDVAWTVGPDGKLVESHDPAKLAEARQSAYGSTSAYFLPKRFPASFSYQGTREDGPARFDVVTVQPVGSTPFELWIDKSSHLVTRFVDRTSPKPTTAYLSDFRDVGGVKISFAFLVSDGDSRHTQTAQVESIEFAPAADKAFDPPSQK